MNNSRIRLDQYYCRLKNCLLDLQLKLNWCSLLLIKLASILKYSNLILISNFNLHVFFYIEVNIIGNMLHQFDLNCKTSLKILFEIYF